MVHPPNRDGKYGLQGIQYPLPHLEVLYIEEEEEVKRNREL
jgi:hypothetical protein